MAQRNEEKLYWIATHLDQASQEELNDLATYTTHVAKELKFNSKDYDAIADAYRKYYMYRQLLAQQKYEAKQKAKESKAFKSATAKKELTNIGQMLRNFSLYLLGWDLKAQNHPKAIELEHKVQGIITKIIPTEIDDKALSYAMKVNDKIQDGFYKLGDKLKNYASEKEFNPNSGRRVKEDEITRRKLFIQGYKQNPNYYEERGIKLNEAGFQRWKESKQKEEEESAVQQGEQVP